MEDNNITISFEIKPTEDFRLSTVNTLVCILKDIKDIEEQPYWDEASSGILNHRIEMAKRELENLRCIEPKEEVYERRDI